MNIQLYPPDKQLNKCFILVGGSGDSVETLQPFIKAVSVVLPEHSICSFTFSSQHDNNLLKQQSIELQQIFSQLESEYSFGTYDIFATSMGAYATVELLQDEQVRQKINNVMFFDPADYYQNLQFTSVDGEITWSGYQPYKPTEPTISDKLANLTGTSPTVDVVHFTIRNHGMNGYVDSDYSSRSIDHSGANPRLSTDMVKAFFFKTAPLNRGQYLEINNVPHGFLRDGDLVANVNIIILLIQRLLTKVH